MVRLLSDVKGSLADPSSGPEAAALRRHARRLLARFRLPDDALPGSLALSHRRCGKPSCHCAEGEGHPLLDPHLYGRWQEAWREHSAAWIDAVRPRVKAGRHCKEAAAELLLINAELLVLARRQRTRPAHHPISSPP